MNTKFYTKTFMIFLLFALLCSSCAEGMNQQTQEAVYYTARIAVDGQVELLGDTSLQDIAPDAWAINAVLTAAPGAYAYLNEVQHLAVFVAPGGKDAAGVQYYFAGFVNTARTCLVDSNRVMEQLGIDGRKVKTLEDMIGALRSKGFVELSPAAAPTLLATLRLGMGFLRTLGGTISDVFIVPVGVFTPENLYPWCEENCQGIQEIHQ